VRVAGALLDSWELPKGCKRDGSSDEWPVQQIHDQTFPKTPGALKAISEAKVLAIVAPLASARTRRVWQARESLS
jgi:hypothetical protein